MTTYDEFEKQILLKLKRDDGLAQIAVAAAINDALMVIALTHDFDELMYLDTANAATVANQSTYHLENDLALTRPKDIYSIRLMDEENSRKLQYVAANQLDELIPYTTQSGTGRSTHYTQRGKSIELFKIPDDAYSLYINHSRWPATLSNATDTPEYEHLDLVIIQLAAEMAASSLDGTIVDWQARAISMLGLRVREELAKPDQGLVARPFRINPPTYLGEYWLNPFVKHE